MLRSAIDKCKVGGYIVYSTCSIAVEENEEVVDYVCRKKYVKIIDTGLKLESKVYKKFGDKKFCDRIKYCIRVFPHIHNLDGFFICKMKKLRHGDRNEENDQKIREKQKKGKKNKWKKKHKEKQKKRN